MYASPQWFSSNEQTKLSTIGTPQNLPPYETNPHFALMPVKSSSLSTPVSESPPKCQTAGFPGIWRFSIKVCRELKVTCRLILHSIGCFSCGETVCPLCWASGEAYHFTPTCRHWPAHGTQNKTLSVCSSVESCPVCAWPGKGLWCLSKVNPCHFTFNAHAHRNLTFISE